MGLLSSGTDILTALYVYLAAAFVLMITVFHHKTLLRKYGDYQAFLRYFGFFFVMFFALPVLIILLSSAEPGTFLASCGFTFGRSQKGLLFMGLSVPIALIAAFIGSRDPVMRAQYPFSKEACSNPKRFVFFEICYLVLYYLPWEFLYRGVLFFPLIPALGLVPALVVQTLISTLHHFGHPDSEIFAALGAGFIFGLIAYATGSFLYTVFIHALVGIGNDTFLYLRYHRPRQRPS
ncbi:MAG: CPBP family intramembrane metalloprotease [Candidatus Aminicenantes bacterium]|nr:CPBP family intramembrane metalloprotease [Candidatus Aminicenantes bacterium]